MAPRKALLLGLDDELVAELKEALAGWTLQIHPELCEDLAGGTRDTRPSMIFCSDGPILDRAVMAAGSHVPVVAVSRLGTPHLWLDVMERGASDYLSMPIDRKEIDWIALTISMKAAAAQMA